MNNKRKFLVHVVEECKIYRVGFKIVEAHTSQEAKALAKDFRDRGSENLGDYDEGFAFAHDYQKLGADLPYTLKTKMSMVELDEDGAPIKRKKFNPTARYVSASTGEII